MKLQPLIDLLSSAEIKMVESTQIEITLSQNLSAHDYEALSQEIFGIEKHSSSKGQNRQLSSTSTAEKGDIITLRVPRSLSGSVVAKDLNDLLSIHGACRIIPKEFLLLEISNNNKSAYWSGHETKPQIIKAYESTVRLSSLLIENSDHTSTDNTCVTFFDIHKLNINLKYTAQDLQWVFPVSEVEDFLRGGNLVTERMEVFRSTLWSLLEGIDEDLRYTSLFATGQNFTMHLRHNLAIIRQDYTLQKRIETARSEVIDLAEKVNKILISIEAKALAVPALALLSINKIDVGAGFSKSNLALILTATLLSIIMWLGYHSLKSHLCSLLKNIEVSEKKLFRGLTLETNDYLHEIFPSLKNRIRNSRIAKQLVAWASVIVLIFITFQGFVATSPTTPTSEQPKPCKTPNTPSNTSNTSNTSKESSPSP